MCRLPNLSSVSDAFWRSTSTWSNGALGIYGAESACRYYDGNAARNIGREQAARLAAILPAPLKRRPERMNYYSARILERMGQMGW